MKTKPPFLKSSSSSYSYSYSLCLLFLTLLATPALAAPPPLASTPVGLEGRVVYRSTDPSLSPAPVDDKAEVTLRIADRVLDSTNSKPAQYIYDLRYIAAVPGDFDLRASLRHADNSPVTEGEALPVHASSSLPANANSDLIPITAGGLTRLGGYRLALIALGLVWIAPLAWVIIRRLRRRVEVAAAPPPAAPTLADQLRPLVESAMNGGLEAPERARLERLLIAHWRERLHLLSRSHADTLNILRLHEHAGPLLIHLEHWLHRPGTNGTKNSVDLNSLLAPYREASPIGGTALQSRDQIPQEARA